VCSDNIRLDEPATSDLHHHFARRLIIDMFSTVLLTRTLSLVSIVSGALHQYHTIKLYSDAVAWKIIRFHFFESSFLPWFPYQKGRTRNKSKTFRPSILPLPRYLMQTRYFIHSCTQSGEAGWLGDANMRICAGVTSPNNGVQLLRGFVTTDAYSVRTCQ
jgi:hypothetical protein